MQSTLPECAKQAVKMCGQEAQVNKVEDIQKIMAYGVMFTPALVVDGVMKVVGKASQTGRDQEMDRVKRVRKEKISMRVHRMSGSDSDAFFYWL